MKENELPLKHQKLVELSGKIKTLLEEYDVAAVVILQNQTHLENLLHLSPSHSLAYMDGTKFKTKRVLATEEDPGKELRVAASTVNMLFNLRYRCQQLVAAIAGAEMAVRHQFGLKPPSPGGKNGSVIPFHPPQN